ncbi:hypothetical protein HDG33_002658 [Paraburkholderia sp. Cpub6]|nr:hypothetical protein [Paraburkholderia sp. Cpub6]
MDLKEFVHASLTQIVEGVRGAQNDVLKHGGYVSPAVYGSTGAETHFAVMPDGQNVFLVDFDVAVTVTEGTASDVEGRLKVASVFGVGGGRKTSGSEEHTSRLRFKVPLALPVDQETKTQLQARDQQVQRQMGAARDQY